MAWHRQRRREGEGGWSSGANDSSFVHQENEIIFEPLEKLLLE